jgi:predicted nuclease of predicted toxin-antitoxin system
MNCDAYFVVDTNVGYVAKHLRQMGHNSESVIEINRRKRLKPKLHRDEQILDYVVDNHAILITADRPFYNRCVNLHHPAMFVEIGNGAPYSKIEQMMILQSRIEATFFRNWLATGMPHWVAYLKYGDGDWGKITRNAKHSQQKINERMDFDPLGYPKPSHHDRQMRYSQKSGKRIKRKMWRKKIDALIAERKRKRKMKRRGQEASE